MSKNIYRFFFILNLLYLCSTIIFYKESTPARDWEFAKSTGKISDIDIQVLNGVGKAGLAREIRNELIDLGFNVLSFGNANKFCYLKSVIIIKKLDYNKLNQLKNIISIPYLYEQSNKWSNYDFVIIVGRDYKKYFKTGK
ncbi:MAG: LytR C-terminal domain-containing protein [Candidatus Cloacimonadota bacterium]|nr:LytR C-terminal domain-containing protein [Candidatus Cloacimonadota bacterium]